MPQIITLKCSIQMPMELWLWKNSWIWQIHWSTCNSKFFEIKKNTEKRFCILLKINDPDQLAIVPMNSTWPLEAKMNRESVSYLFFLGKNPPFPSGIFRLFCFSRNSVFVLFWSDFACMSDRAILSRNLDAQIESLFESLYYFLSVF